jgi:hypothetical protein
MQGESNSDPAAFANISPAWRGFSADAFNSAGSNIEADGVATRRSLRLKAARNRISVHARLRFAQH